MVSAFLFRRDLRLEDNVGLIQALKRSDVVVPIFIFNPKQLKNNPYRSEAAVQFMIQSLKDLDDNLKNKGSKLYCFIGEPESVLKQLCKNLNLTDVFANEDYTPFASERDKLIEKKISFRLFADALLTRPESVLKDDYTPYTVYTPFMKKAKKQKVRTVSTDEYDNYYKKDIDKTISIDSIKYVKNFDVQNGGRTEGLKLLKQLKNLNDYKTKRDYPAQEYTSRLSAHHKFGTISIRETYHKAFAEFGADSVFIKQLYWRDFYTHIAYHFPKVFGNNFNKKYDKVVWEEDKDKFQSWCEGKTGFPIVDAGMRQLNKTGYMHNRLRMIVASFLTKDLRIDWRKGEKYFAQKLVDYDPAVNNGSWQWAASTGCDAQPYFRIFNPWLQQKKFDESAEYIKKWIPELKDVPTKEIHDWEFSNHIHNINYPKPIIDHFDEKKKTLKMFNDIS